MGKALGMGGDGGAAKALERQQKQLLEQQQATQALANDNVAAEVATVDTAGTADTQNSGISTRRKRAGQSLTDQLGLNT